MTAAERRNCLRLWVLSAHRFGVSACDGLQGNGSTAYGTPPRPKTRAELVRERILALDAKGELPGVIAERLRTSSETVRRILRKAGRLHPVGRPENS